MHETQTIAVNNPSICQVCGCAEMAERINVMFGVEIPGDPRHIVLDGGPHPFFPTKRGRGRDLMQLLTNYFGTGFRYYSVCEDYLPAFFTL